ncbi:muscarinic acetylcholine receptor M2-like [Diadema antillarum]|uniref:muscarinic acetylcholine receptor M2-like n=1 Tax=Diadema antillarum TaxID=105358 RepID=UPI003A8BBF0E
MTLADLFVGAVIMPIRCTIDLYGTWVLGHAFGVIFLTVMNASLGVSVMGVVVITIDRYIATLHPITHYTKKSKHVAVVINFVTWITPFVIWGFLNAVWDFVDPVEGTTGSGLPRPHYTVTLPLSLLVFCLRFAGPFFIIAVLYLRIYYHIRLTRKNPSELKNFRVRTRILPKSVRGRPNESGESDLSRAFKKRCSEDAIVSEGTKIVESISYLVSNSTHGNPRQGTNTDNVQERHRKHVSDVTPDETSTGYVLSVNSTTPGKLRARDRPERESPVESRKAMTTLTFILVAFAASWIPNVTNVLFYCVSPSFYDFVARKMGFNEVARWITFLNSLFNPVAYAVAQPLIRQTIARMFCWGCR